MATLETETQAAPLDTTAWEAALDAGDLPALTALHRRTPALLTASLRGGSQALHVAAAHGHTAVVAWLLGHQAPVDGADASGLTPLHYAGSAAVVTLLLNAGARPAAREPRFGCTPLHTITSVKAAAALMAAGVSVELIDFRGRTPLHVAARQGNVPLVQALLDAGASPMARDDAGLTPQLHAERKKRTDVIALLRAAHTPPPAPDAEEKIVLNPAEQPTAHEQAEQDRRWPPQHTPAARRIVRRHLRTGLLIVGIVVVLGVLCYLLAGMAGRARDALGYPALDRPLDGLVGVPYKQLKMEWNFRDPQLDVASGRWVAHGEDYDPHTELRGFCNVYQNEDGQRAYCIELVVDGYAKQATTAEKLNATAGTIFADVLRLSCFTDAERTRGAGWLALEAAQADMPGRLLTVRCAHVRLIFSGSRWSRTLAVFAG